MFKYPTNISNKDRCLFDPHKDPILNEPEFKNLSFGLVYKNGLVFTAKGICSFSKPWPYWKGGYTFSFWVKSLLKSFISFKVTLSVANDTKALVLTPMSDNYFHWMTEVLPKLLYVKKTGIKFSILLHNDFTKSYQIESLNLLGVKYLYFNYNFCIFRKGILINNFAKYPGYYNTDYIHQLRNKLLSSIHLKELGDNVSERIYITRKNANRRKVINEKEVVDIMKAKYFKIVDFAELSVAESIKLINNAKYIVSIHGAGLTNMIFATQNCVVCELLMENTIVDKCYFNLANTLNLEYNYILCKSNESSPDHINNNIVVPLVELSDFCDRYKL